MRPVLLVFRQLVRGIALFGLAMISAISLAMVPGVIEAHGGYSSPEAAADVAFALEVSLIIPLALFLWAAIEFAEGGVAVERVIKDTASGNEDVGKQLDETHDRGQMDIGMLIILVIGVASAAILFFQFFGFLTYRYILPRVRPSAAERISGILMRIAFRHLPGDGLTTHEDSGGMYHLAPFTIDDGTIWIGDLPFGSVDEVRIGSIYGVPFLGSTYRGFAGLVNMGLAKVGEEIQKIRYKSIDELSESQKHAMADGGIAEIPGRDGPLALVGETIEGEEIVIPDRAVVDTSKIQYADTNSSVPDKAARAVKNAEAKAREDMDITPMRMAMIVIGSIALGAGIVIFGMVLIGSVGDSVSSVLLPFVLSGAPFWRWRRS